MTGFPAFVDSLLSRSFAYKKALRPARARAAAALEQSVADARFHDRNETPESVAKGIVAGDHRLPVFLYRLGRAFFLENPAHPLVPVLHGLMRQTSACEIYFSNDIGPGFRMVHGLGTVIGSRNIIGAGFTIYQGSTIGHRSVGEPGAVIGSGVTVFAHSLVLGAVRVGDGAVIGAHTLVLRDVPAGAVVSGKAKS